MKYIVPIMYCRQHNRVGALHCVSGLKAIHAIPGIRRVIVLLCELTSELTVFLVTVYVTLGGPVMCQR